jgi:peroxiredoxin
MLSITRRFAYFMIFFFAMACQSKQHQSLEVKGSISHTDLLATQYPGSIENGNIRLSLNEISFGSDNPPVRIDTFTLHAGDSSFVLKGKTSHISMYSLEIENGPIIPLVNDEAEMTVNLDFSQKDKFYNVSGSEASASLQQFISDYADKSHAINESLTVLDSLKRLNAGDSVLLEATSSKNKAIDNLNSYLENYLGNAKQAIVASFALGRAAQTLPQASFEKSLNSLAQKFPADPSITAIKSQYENFRKQSEDLEKERQAKSLVGKQAPELSLPDVNGKEVALSSFRGKYVLVDFWASWCRPCRDENPNVVEAYNKFKNKNFTILGVSLDRKKEDWLQAIKDDQLNWTQVSDLAFWNSKAVSTFNFDGIPFNVLIDPQGKVIAESLRGEELQAKLSEVLQ